MKYTLGASNESIATNTGALIGFVVIKLPHTDDKQRNITEAPTRPGTATIARNMWPWTVASDYREPANQRLDMPPTRRFGEQTTPHHPAWRRLALDNR